MARFLKATWDAVLEQHERWIFWLPVPLAAGIALYFSLRFEPPAYAGPALLAIFVVLSGAFYRNRQFWALWLAVLMLLAGFSAAQLRSWQVAEPMLHKKTFPVTVVGRIAAVDPLPKTERIVVEDFSIETGKIWQDELPRRVRIKLKGNDPAQPRAGDRIAIKAVLQPVSGPVMPGAFDFQRYAFFERLGATGYAIGDLEVREKAEEGFFFERLRQKIRNRIFEVVENKEHAALLTAFMVGESRGIPENIWQVARDSGIAHLIAISGSHFVLIAGFPFFLIRALLAAMPFIALRWPIKKIAAFCAILVSVFYMLLIDSPIPAQRAVISVSVIMLAIMLDRDPFTQRLAAFSALVILLFRPEALTGASFQMSFAAIVALIAFYEATRDWWRRMFDDESLFRRVCFVMVGCFMTSFIASTATAPFSLFHFSTVPWVAGLAANMVAVPITSFITFPAGLLGCALMPFGLDAPLLLLAEKSLGSVMQTAQAVAGWEFGRITTPPWPTWLLAFAALGGLWICFWQGRVRWLGLAPVALAAALIFLLPRPDVLVSDSGRLIAARAPDGKLWASSQRIERFIRQQWETREGGAYEDDKDVATCDATGCVYRSKGRIVSYLFSTAELERDCRIADVIVTPQAVENCRRGRAAVIGRSALRQGGAHAIYLSEDGFRIVSTNGLRGERLWNAKPVRSSDRRY